MKISNQLIIVALTIMTAMSYVSCNNEDENINRLKPARDIVLTRMESDVCKNISDYSFKLFAKLAKVEDQTEVTQYKNTALSPFGLWMMTSQLAKEGSEAFQKSFLHQMMDTDSYLDLDKFNLKLAKELPLADESIVFTSANSRWMHTELSNLYPEDLKENLSEYYATEWYERDMYLKATVDEFNNWVYKKTNGKISHVVTKENMGAEIVYANAFYFQGAWTQRLTINDNEVSKFYNADGSISNVSMMIQETESYFSYIEDREFGFLPIGNGAYKMYVILPQKGESIEHCADWLANGAGISILGKEITPSSLKLIIPPFIIEDENDRLEDLLENIGIDFSKINAKIKQKTYFKANEEGTESAAVSMGIPCVGTTNPNFVLDRPFIYFIAEKSTGTVLMIGAVRKL